MKSDYYKEIEINFLKHYFKNADMTKSRFDPADFILYLPNDVTIVGELKFRHQSLNSYRNEKFMEVKKYKLLKDKNASNILYINLFEDSNDFCVWKLNELDIENRKIHNRKMKKTTASDFNYSNIDEYKDVYYLSVDEAKAVKSYDIKKLTK